jgi:hypothetical protein
MRFKHDLFRLLAKPIHHRPGLLPIVCDNRIVVEFNSRLHHQRDHYGPDIG